MRKWWYKAWPQQGDQQAALSSMLMGAVAAAMGTLVVLYLALRALSHDGLSLSAVVIPLAGAIALAAAAIKTFRRALAGPQVALVIWLILGVLPTDIPWWLGLLVLLALVSAARGAFVLGRLNRATD